MKPYHYLIVGGSTNEANKRLPQADEVWTFLSAWKADKSLRQVADLAWDCHSAKPGIPATAHYKGDTVSVVDVRRPSPGLHVAQHVDLARRTYAGTFSDQLCYMLATIYEMVGSMPRPIRVSLWRCIYDQQEYVQAVPWIMYWLGMLESEGISIFIDPTSSLRLARDYASEVRK